MERRLGVCVQVSVLGSVRVRRDGAEVALGPRLWRLLAALVVANRSVVSSDRLVDIVWEGAPPDGADKSLSTYVTRLRQALGADRDDVIVFRQPGYVIDLRREELDSEVFDDEVERALQHLRTAEPEVAAELAADALGRWSGPAYAGVAEEEWARPESVRLEERRLEAREALIEARLAAGSAQSAASEAQALVEAEPLRERPRALLMRALYATGRQAEALRVFAAYRRFLVEETGLDPSADIAELETRIARADPGLDGPSQQLRGYELGERIGEGAFSVVHRAVQPGIGRDVAVKIIRPELADRADFIRRFEFEAQTIARLEHPNVVPLYDFWREPGAAYLVMRWLRGGSVEQALRTRGAYSREQTLRLVADVAGALETAHRAGVVHRDVRPANLLVDTEGTTYLADFGIAVPAATADDLPIVSPAYAAPEVLRGEPSGVPADVLSLGVTVFEVLTGRLPFADSLERADVIRRQLTEPLPPVRATRTDLPAQVDEVLARATAKAAGDRYATVGAFVADLEAALGAGGGRPRFDLAAPLPRPEVENPYVGLHAFGEHDAERFHGREGLIAELVEAVERRPMVVVVGPSGSGKSSVVRAGLLPALRRGAVAGSDRWFVTTMVPGSDPVDALEAALLRVAVDPPASLRGQLAEAGGLLRSIRRVLPDDRARILLVVDQLEELFTQVHDADERDRFLTELAAAITHPTSPLRVVATLRADHYDTPLRHPAMADLVTDGTVTVRPMSPDELERAITEPAASVGVELEAALAVELVAEVNARPAALPLLQFSLTELFDRRVSDTMLAAEHRELGGLTGALAARADRIVDDGGPDDAAEVRRIFGRLVTLGDGVEDTRRRARRSEFGSDERTAWLLDAYITARLLTTDRDPATREPTIEVAHEALLRDWPRLRGWLEEDRIDLRTLHGIGVAADAWIAAERDRGELARSGRLASAADLAGRHPDWLNDDEHEWLTASAAAARADADAEAAAVDRDRRQNRRLRALLATAVALLVVALGAATGAFVLRDRAIDSERDTARSEREAADARDRALVDQAVAETAREEAESERLAAIDARDDARRQGEIADANRIATAAIDALGDDPELALLLALTATGGDAPPGFGQLRALHAAIDAHRTTATIEHDAPDAWTTQGSLSPDGSLALVGGAIRAPLSVHRLDGAGSELLWTADFPAEWKVLAAFTADGEHVIARTVWPNPPDRGIPDTPADPSVYGVYVFHAPTGELVRRVDPEVCADSTVAYNLSLQSGYSLWSDGRRGSAPVGDVLAGWCQPRGPEGFAEYPGRWWLMDPVSGTIVEQQDDDRGVWWVFPTVDGRLLQIDYAGATDIVDRSTGEVLHTFVHPDAPEPARPLLSPNGEYLLIDDTVYEPDTGRPVSRLEPATGDLSGCGFYTTSFTFDDARIVVGCDDARLLVFDPATGEQQFDLRGHGGWTVPGAGPADPDTIVSGSADGTVRIWDVGARGELGLVDPGAGYVADAGTDLHGDTAVALVYPSERVSPFDELRSFMTRHAVGELVVFEPETGRVLRRVGGVGGKVARFSPDGERVVVQTAADAGLGPLAVVEVATGDTVIELEGLCRWRPGSPLDCPEDASATIAADATDLAWSPDGRSVAMAGGSSQRLVVWDVSTGRIVFDSQPMQFDPQSAVAWSPDGARVVTSSKTGMWVFSTSDWELERFIPHQGRPSWVMHFTTDGSELVTAQAHTGEVRIYDVGAWTERIVRGGIGQTRDVAVDDTGARVAIASRNGDLHVVDLETGELLQLISVTGADITNVEFLDGDRLLVSRSTGPFEIVALDADAVVAAARSRVTRGFTADECERYELDPCPGVADLRPDR